MYDAINGPSPRYSDALNTAVAVEKCSMRHAETGRGMVAFYGRQYSLAAQHFKKAYDLIDPALVSEPGYDIQKRNLADAYLEAGDHANAIVYYQQISTHDALWAYKMSWAQLMKADVSAAQALANQVPADFSEDGNIPGRSEMLRAAILLVQSAQLQGDQAGIAFEEARSAFTSAFEKDPASWTSVLDGGFPSRNESFGFLRTTLLNAGGAAKLLIQTRSSEMWETIAIFAFGVLFVGIILALAFAFPRPTIFQYTVCRIILALAGAGVATLITGFLNVEISNFIKAGGALAVFVIVYFKTPAQLVVQKKPT